MKKELIVLVGNIGSGKSTYVKYLQKKGYIVIARDMLRYAIGGGEYVYNLEYEPTIFATEKYMLRKFLDLGKNIVIDEIGISISLRAIYIREAKQRGYKVTCIEMPRLSKEESVNRRMQNPHGQNDREIWEGVWERFDLLYEPPLSCEGFDKILCIK